MKPIINIIAAVRIPASLKGCQILAGVSDNVPPEHHKPTAPRRGVRCLDRPIIRRYPTEGDANRYDLLM